MKQPAMILAWFLSMVMAGGFARGAESWPKRTPPGRQSWAGFWGYSDVRGGTPWNQLSGGNDRNWCPAYIDFSSAADGKHWLAIFEGVQDYEYLLMLKDRIAAARQAGRDDETVAAAQKLLDELPDEVIAAVRAGDQTACDMGRLRVLAALETL